MKVLLTIFLGLLFAIQVRAQHEVSLNEEVSEVFLEKLIETAKTNYPKGKIYDARIEGANYAVKRMKLSYFDIFSFSYLFMPNNYATVSPLLQTSYQFGFFASIGSLIQKPAQIKQTKSEMKAVGLEKQVFELNLEADVRERYYTLIQKKVLLRIIGESLLDLESMVRLTRYKFEKGEETLESYNKALMAVSNQKMARAMTESEILIAKSALEELLGQKLENVK